MGLSKKRGGGRRCWNYRKDEMPHVNAIKRERGWLWVCIVFCVGIVFFSHWFVAIFIVSYFPFFFCDSRGDAPPYPPKLHHWEDHSLDTWGDCLWTSSRHVLWYNKLVYLPLNLWEEYLNTNLQGHSRIKQMSLSISRSVHESFPSPSQWPSTFYLAAKCVLFPKDCLFRKQILVNTLRKMVLKSIIVWQKRFANVT